MIIYRLVVTLYSFFQIGKAFYDASQEEKKNIKYEKYGEATYMMCTSLLYLFTGIKISLFDKRKLKRFNRLKRFAS